MPLTPEELAEQQRVEAEKAEAAKKAAEAEEARKKEELESIPEALRGKSAKELSDMLLEASLQAEKEKRGREEKEAELAKLRPSKTLDQLSEVEKKALREKEFITDPTAFLDRHVEERLRPMTEEYYKDRAETVFVMAKKDKESYPEFAKFEKGIKEILDKMPIEARANPQAIDLAYKIVEYPELKKRDIEARARGGLHSEEGGVPKVTPKVKRELDEDEQAVAKKFGLTPEQYIEWSEKRGIE